VYFPAGDDRVYRALADAGVAGRTPSIGDIERSACILAVGDPFEIGPVIAGPVLKGKHARRSNILAVISNGRTRTSRFATMHFSGPERSTLAGLLRCIADESGSDGPGWMRAVRDHMPASHDAAVMNLAAAFTRTPSSVMILETQDPVTASLAALVVRAAGGERKLLPILSYANTAGICPVIEDTQTVETVLDASLRGEVDALLVLGADPARGGFGEDIRSARESVRFLAAGAPFGNDTTRMADLVLPTALWLETGGSYNGARLNPVVEPPGEALSCGELLRRLAGKLDKTLHSDTIKPASDEGEPTPGMVEMLASHIDEEPLAPQVRSSTVRYGDGSLTDHMGWYSCIEAHGW
jgi:hypothetical protein